MVKRNSEKNPSLKFTFDQSTKPLCIGLLPRGRVISRLLNTKCRRFHWLVQTPFVSTWRPVENCGVFSRQKKNDKRPVRRRVSLSLRFIDTTSPGIREQTTWRDKFKSRITIEHRAAEWHVLGYTKIGIVCLSRDIGSFYCLRCRSTTLDAQSRV